ncbi:SAVED domain-containing protein [Chitinimonas sp. BJYL2]|uniref:SAVED domain-containing protein n=1 Tax=Chitinimonas sp. BJYL2 TaxID=2976696 RepID=UPI0022B5A260|nr:SAVED domain-containing protein [Chitinimonas sp. BJYL2]
MAHLLQELLAAGKEPLLVVNQFTCSVFSRTASTDVWAFEGIGDLGGESLAAISSCRRGIVKWAVTSAANPKDADLAALAITAATKSLLQTWQAAALKITSTKGRTGDVTPKTAQKVFISSAWRCQFEGCGEDLTSHFATDSHANYSYLAHIVASSVDGPRGDPVWSPRLADDAENIMLLCDKCHRLIDRVAPAFYTTEKLRAMRARNVTSIKRLLAGLQYPPAVPIMLIGNVTGQPHHYSKRNVEDAMLNAGLRSSRDEPEYFCCNNYILHNPHSTAYWGCLFESLSTDIPRLRALLNGSARGQARPHLAIFPVHSTSVLILGGRLIGDTAGVSVFQFHRDKVAGNQGGQWAWPSDAIEPSTDKYRLEVLKDFSGQNEACLLVSLTFDVALDRLTTQCFENGELRLPTIKLIADRFGSDVMGHPKDLELFGTKLDEAVRKLQDQWKVQRIHLIVGAPASACFRVGQKMQARNQATYVCYETDRGIGSSFKATIEISSNMLTGPNGEQIAL